MLTECDEGKYGANCDQTCQCQNDADCDLVTGQCHCLPGWIGPLCEHACPSGRYGVNCSHVCQCLNDSPCDHATGVCDCAPGFTGPHCETRQCLICIHCRQPQMQKGTSYFIPQFSKLISSQAISDTDEESVFICTPQADILSVKLRNIWTSTEMAGLQSLPASASAFRPIHLMYRVGQIK